MLFSSKIPHRTFTKSKHIVVRRHHCEPPDLIDTMLLFHSSIRINSNTSQIDCDLRRRRRHNIICRTKSISRPIEWRRETDQTTATGRILYIAQLISHFMFCSGRRATQRNRPPQHPFNNTPTELPTHNIKAYNVLHVESQ